MSTSPIPPDPYEVLSLPKTCDLESVKKAHRKLVLKYHPDRIKDPALQEQGKNEFQRVQQAYELLSDPAKRARYDDKVRLAELRRDRMMHDSMSSARSTFTTTSYTARPTPTATASFRREMRGDGSFYEDRSPDSYFDARPARDRYEEPPIRGATRKAESYEKRPTSSKSSEKKEKEKPRSGWDGPVKGMSMRMAFNLKKSAQAAKERTREDHARSAKARDKEEQRARTEKQSGSRYARVEDDSESDSDTVVPPPRRPATRDGKPATHTRGASSPESLKQRPPPPPRARSYNDEESDDDTASKWERHHEESRAYILESQKRPQMGRSGSNAHVYWEKEVLRDRRSGSDSDKRPSSSSKTNRRSAGATEARARPAMPTQNSAPSNLKANMVNREPTRSKTAYSPEAKSSPGLKRAETMPMPPKSRKESNPTRGSNLKHTETMHDSGYGSSSSPHTPEMRGESPPPREPRRRETSTKYSIVDPASDEDGRKPRLNRIPSDDDRPRRYERSPDGTDERRVPRERPVRPRVDTDTRPRSSRGTFSPADGRPNFHSSPRESPSVSRHNSGKLFGEKPPEDTYQRRVDPNSVRYASYRSPEDYDSVVGSQFRSPAGSRRPSIYA